MTHKQLHHQSPHSRADSSQGSLEHTAQPAGWRVSRPHNSGLNLSRPLVSEELPTPAGRGLVNLLNFRGFLKLFGVVCLPA